MGIRHYCDKCTFSTYAKRHLKTHYDTVHEGKISFYHASSPSHIHTLSLSLPHTHTLFPTHYLFLSLHSLPYTNTLHSLSKHTHFCLTYFFLYHTHSFMPSSLIRNFPLTYYFSPTISLSFSCPFYLSIAQNLSKYSLSRSYSLLHDLSTGGFLVTPIC